MEEFVHQLKTNRTVRYVTVGATVVVAYQTGGFWGVWMTPREKLAAFPGYIKWSTSRYAAASSIRRARSSADHVLTAFSSGASYM